MSTDNSQDNPIRSLTDKIRSWFERTPRAQRAYEKLSADLDTVVSKVESIVDENDTLRDLRTKVGAAIDPPASPPEPAAAVDAPAALPTADAKATPPTPAEAETSPPPPPASSPPTSSSPPLPSSVPTSITVESPTPSTADPTSGTIEARRLPGGDTPA